MLAAPLQRQLAAATLGEVDVAGYFTDLRRSIASSMISDPTYVTLIVQADSGAVSADASVSMGLIVTDCASGPAWMLSVTDDGVGMASNDEKYKAGLGMSIDAGLAKQLGARLDVSPCGPGTRASLIRARSTSDASTPSRLSN